MSVVVSTVQDDEGKSSALFGEQTTPSLHVLAGSRSDTDDQGTIDTVEVVGPSPTQTSQLLHQDDPFGPPKRSRPLGEAFPTFVADESSQEGLGGYLRTVGGLECGRSAGFA